MTNEIEMTRTDFHEKALQLLLKEVLKLKFQVSKLKGDDTEEMADMTVEFLREFLALFPEENQEMLHDLMADEIAQIRKQDAER